MKVKVVSVKAFEVFDVQGGSLGMFLVDSEWQGLQRLKSVDGKTEMIISPGIDGLAGMFASIFGGERCEAQVIKITPDLGAKLKEAANAAGVPA